MVVLLAIDRNLVRMYVILAICALLFFGLLFVLASRAAAARREARKREAVAGRLAAVIEQAAHEHRARSAATEASTALTTVLPAITAGEHAPRHVA